MTDKPQRKKKSGRRTTTIYDAVAGRITSKGLRKEETQDNLPVAPDDYLLHKNRTPEEGIPVIHHPALPDSVSIYFIYKDHSKANEILD